MTSTVRIERLTEKNFADYESLTSCQEVGGCNCAFWHQKWSSVDASKQRQREAPELNRTTIVERMASGFHVGVLVYDDKGLAAWVSVGPLIDFYWTWRRVGQIGGDVAKATAAIMCFTVAPSRMGQGLQANILAALNDYGRQAGWKAIESYPFESPAMDLHGESLVWPGIAKGYEAAGYQMTGPHWLSSKGYERSIYKIDL